VGFSRRTGARTDSDVYVVHVGENGGVIWETTIDVNHHFGDDAGTSVRELYHSLYGGFVVTGTTAVAIGASRDVFLLELDCNGGLVWVQLLRTLGDQLGAPTDDVASDVMETNTGPLAAGGGAAQGDLVVAGSSRRQLGPKAFDTDAYLVRTDAFGSVRWSRTYSNWGGFVADPHYREWFNAVSEAQPTLGQGVGDVLAAGAYADTGWEDGLAVRVDGANGGMTLPLHAMASFNLPAAGPQERPTELWAIRELQQAGPELFNIVVVGHIADTGGKPEGYAAKTGPNLNALLAERAIGDGFAGLGTEGFADFVEISAPTSYAGAGDLAVTGYATINGSQDVALLALSAGTLAPVTGTGRLFGDHAGGEERGTALCQVHESDETARSAGLYINGFIRSDPALVGDPEDMYLIKTDATGRTPCSLDWSPVGSTDEHEICECSWNIEDVGTINYSLSSPHESPSWGNMICQ